jgi:sulfur relay protein TusB/DsrH
MIVIIKSAPRTEKAERGLKLAQDTSSDVVLVQDGVRLAGQGVLDGLAGTVYMLEDDVKLRGMGARAGGVRQIGYTRLVGLMADTDRVMGMF